MAKETDVKQLLADLRDFNKERRRKAVYKLGMVGGEEALQALRIAVENENEDLIVRGRAAQMLGRVRDPRAVQSLIYALGAPGHQTPMHAAEALGRIGDKRAIPALTGVAETHESASTRQAAQTALTALGHGSEPDLEMSNNLEPIGEPEA